MSLLQNPCSVCGLAILSGDSFIGTGDGQMTNGGSFAHDVCYYRDQANHLQKLCEEQKGEIAELNAWKHGKKGIEEYYEVKAERDELKFLLMQTEAELTLRNGQLDKVRFQSDIYAKQVVLKEELVNERSAQLATQTERVQTLEKELEALRGK